MQFPYILLPHHCIPYAAYLINIRLVLTLVSVAYTREHLPIHPSQHIPPEHSAVSGHNSSYQESVSHGLAVYPLDMTRVRDIVAKINQCRNRPHRSDVQESVCRICRSRANSATECVKPCIVHHEGTGMGNESNDYDHRQNATLRIRMFRFPRRVVSSAS